MYVRFGKQNLHDSPSVSDVIFSRQEPDSWNLLCAIFNVCKESWNTPSSWSNCCLNIVSCWRFKFGKVAKLITCDCGDDFTVASCDILTRNRFQDARVVLRILYADPRTVPLSSMSPNTGNDKPHPLVDLNLSKRIPSGTTMQAWRTRHLAKRQTSSGKVFANIFRIIIQILSRIGHYSSY